MRRDLLTRAALIATVLATSAAWVPAAATAQVPDANGSHELSPTEPGPQTATRKTSPAGAAPQTVARQTPPPAPSSRIAARELPPGSIESQETNPEPPLVAYALELSQTESRSDIAAREIARSNLRAVTFEMSRHPPPSNDECAHTLGASRFAQQYARLATIHDQLGNFEAALEANESALACRPREGSYEAAIASAHLNLDHLAEARAAVERGYVIDPDNPDVREVRARLDFIQERWADATTRFRLEVLEEKYANSPYTDYARCYLWLAQRRAGVRDPKVPEPPRSGSKEQQDRGTHWPAPILDTLRGKLTENDLVNVIREDGDSEEREWLSEALFYVGELRLAEGDAETARRHFASVVNLRVLNFVEYGMARAELQKMRDRDPVARAATVETSTRAR